MDYPIILFGILSQLGHDNASLFLRSSFGVPSVPLRSGIGVVTGKSAIFLRLSL